jgi:hypothetical protein
MVLTGFSEKQPLLTEGLKRFLSPFLMKYRNIVNDYL